MCEHGIRMHHIVVLSGFTLPKRDLRVRMCTQVSQGAGLPRLKLNVHGDVHNALVWMAPVMRLGYARHRQHTEWAYSACCQASSLHDDMGMGK